MVIYYSIAKEAKYQQDDDNNYIDCAVAVKVNGNDTTSDEVTLSKANEMKKWIAEQMEIFPVHLKSITKKEFDAIED